MINIGEQAELADGGELTVNWHKKKSMGEEGKEEEVEQYMDNANIAAILNEFNLLNTSER